MMKNLFVQEKDGKKTASFATIAEIYDDGISLLFDGETTPSQKHYQCNTSAVFAKGNRVKILRDSGTYIVEYPVGKPNITR